MRLFILLALLVSAPISTISGSSLFAPMYTDEQVRHAIIPAAYMREGMKTGIDRLVVTLRKQKSFTSQVQKNQAGDIIGFSASIWWFYTATYDGKAIPCPRAHVILGSDLCQVNQVQQHKNDRAKMPRQPIIQKPKRNKQTV